jgi:hypothetical protein
LNTPMLESSPKQTPNALQSSRASMCPSFVRDGSVIQRAVFRPLKRSGTRTTNPNLTTLAQSAQSRTDRHTLTGGCTTKYTKHEGGSRIWTLNDKAWPWRNDPL